MEASELAERILFGDRLEDKLFDGGRVLDRHPGAPRTTPERPGRPPELSLDSWHERERVRFNDVRRFHTDKERGLVLHFFANHELLALELIALALLKFPEAPAKFRRGLVATLRDEQEHLRLYIDRMREIGVGFGEIPVSDFFWRSISAMQTPMDYVTRLSLTLEQANLDYAPHYQDIYAKLGDEATSALMNRVYRDEIRHVRYGLTWFEAWRDPAQSQWEAYCAALGAPLTPNRAKGIGFNREGRRRAGLSAEFVGELELYSRSRGRCPAVYWFNPTCDHEAGHGSAGFTPPKAVTEMARDLAGLPLFLASRDDVVLTPQRPSADFLRRLRDAGFAIPELVAYGDPPLNVARTDLVDRKLQRLRPWGWSPAAARALAPLVASSTTAAGVEAAAPEAGAMRELYSKSWSLGLLRRLLANVESESETWLCDQRVAGEVCTCEEQVGVSVRQLWAAGFREVAIKGPFGAAGQDQIRVSEPPDGGGDSFEAGAGEAKRAWLQRLLRDFGEVVVEPWLDGRVDLSAQFEVESGRPPRLLGITRFVTDARGQYIGSFVHQKVAGLDEAHRRFLYGDGTDGRRFRRLFEQLGAMIQPQTDAAAYSGPLGVDALVYREREEDGQNARLRLKPVVEVNPRYTMGHLALRLGRRVNASRTALWTMLRARDVVEAGFADVAAFAAHMQRVAPCESTDGGQLSRGILFTTDPLQARAFTSLLIVGESLAQCVGYFEGFGGRLERWRRHWV